MNPADELAARLSALPPEALVPAGWVLEQLGLAVRLPPPAADRLPPADLTIAEVAARVGRSPSTVRGWCCSGRLKAYKLSHRDHRVTVAALEQFLAAERNGRAA